MEHRASPLRDTIRPTGSGQLIQLPRLPSGTLSRPATAVSTTFRLACCWLLATLSLHNARALDLDDDGLSDVWAAIHGIASGVGAENPDGDRWDNRMESLLSTDPHDPARQLRHDLGGRPLGRCAAGRADRPFPIARRPALPDPIER